MLGAKRHPNFAYLFVCLSDLIEWPPGIYRESPEALFLIILILILILILLILILPASS